MNGNGPTGQFANLRSKRDKEIPMAVLLPSGGPVRTSITGTDCDGIREVSGVTAIHEVKAITAPEVSKAQFRALKELGTFFVSSRWLYERMGSTSLSREEEIARDNHYVSFAVPKSATVWANGSKAHTWLYRYLTDCGFLVSQGVTNGLSFQFSDPRGNLKTHRHRPTKEWLAIAFIPDYYHLFLQGDYCFPTAQIPQAPQSFDF